MPKGQGLNNFLIRSWRINLVSRCRFPDLKIQPLSVTIEPSSGSQSELRRSSRTGKGSGGQLDQLRNIERVQTTVHARPSTRSLEIATQGHPVNPMAPSYPFDDEEAESQIPPVSSSGSTLTSQDQGVPDEVKAQPSFALSQPGDQFGFKLPSSSISRNFGVASQPVKVSSILQNQVR